MPGHRRAHTYTIRPAIGGPPVLTATVDRTAATVTMTTASGEKLTVDVTTARAMWMTFQAAVYDETSLPADGPRLALEVDRGTGRPVAERRRHR